MLITLKDLKGNELGTATVPDTAETVYFDSYNKGQRGIRVFERVFETERDDGSNYHEVEVYHIEIVN